jgi:hypothetical protein
LPAIDDFRAVGVGDIVSMAVKDISESKSSPSSILTDYLVTTLVL